MTIGHKLLGSGSEAVLMLHGWFADHSAFTPMFDSLDTNTFTYAFIDYRGYGLSRDIKGEYSIAEISRDAIALAGSMRQHLNI